MWIQLPYHSGQFYINNSGDVKNTITNNILTPDENNSGYYRISMWENSTKIRKFQHRLVAETFIPNLENKKFVNHIDGNKRNNHVDNLEWVTQSENELHAYETGLQINHNKKEITIIMMDGLTITFDSFIQASKWLNLSPSLINQWIRGLSNTYSKYNISEIII